MSPRSALASSSAVALLLLFACPQAMAQEAPLKQFGDANQFALSLNHNLLVNKMDLLSGDELQASFFPVRGLSLGLAFGVQWWSDSPLDGSPSNMVLHVGPRVGYDLHFSPLVSLWPQVGVDYRSLTTWESSPTYGQPQATTSTTQTSSAFGLSLMAPVLLHPSRGFFIGAGPAFYTDFSNSFEDTTNGVSMSSDRTKITSVGVVAVIGGAV